MRWQGFAGMICGSTASLMMALRTVCTFRTVPGALPSRVSRAKYSRVASRVMSAMGVVPNSGSRYVLTTWP